jgi:hypothetical protein
LEQVKFEEVAMKKSTELIKFFIKIAILAVASSATGLFSEGQEVPFELITLDETASCMA